MHLVDILLNNSAADLALLRANEEKADTPTAPRSVDFIFYPKDQKNGEMICSFIHDNSFGAARYRKVPGNTEERSHQVIVTVDMPTTDHVACSVSGLMACIGHLFGIEYDGWGSPLVVRK